MKVVLPDNSELELPEGATGLDAARAIGSKLAEQAVLVRLNGTVQDLRLPLHDGEKIHFLTTRDTADPDALYVLRHSAAHLLAEAVRRLELPVDQIEELDPSRAEGARRGLLFLAPYFDERPEVRVALPGPLGAVGQDEQHHLGSRRGPTGQGRPATELDVVGVGADGEHPPRPKHT